MPHPRQHPIWQLSRKEFRNRVKTCVSVKALLQSVGIEPGGHGYVVVKQRMEEEDLDYTEFKTRMEAAKKRLSGPSLEDIMVMNSSYQRTRLKQRLIREELLPYRCQICDQEPEWQGEELVLILDHINGINNDHRKENLRFLCPNCNSQTETFAGRNRRGPPSLCMDCAKPCSKCAKRCQTCANRKENKRRRKRR